MKRVIDKQYFTYSAYTALKSSIYVKCANCKGLGFVTADEDFAHFKCSQCGTARVIDRTIYHYDVHNQCKKCERFYRVDINDKSKQRFTSLHVACPYCGYLMSGKVHKTTKAGYYYIGEINHGHEPYFGLELWFLTHFNNKIVWAVNREHLAYLITYIRADVREKSTEYTMKTQADHLPTFMKTSKNRDKMVKLLEVLQKK